MITLKTLEQATTQEVFDQAANHLLITQMKKSTNPNSGYCLYRSEEGLKCAAGCFIADDEYEKEFENKTWTEMVTCNYVTGIHVTIISELQGIHDVCSPEEWKIKLKELADNFNLKWNFE